MQNENQVLSKIEILADKLPYRSLDITIEMDNKTLTLNKKKGHPIGFTGRSEGD